MNRVTVKKYITCITSKLNSNNASLLVLVGSDEWACFIFKACLDSYFYKAVHCF